MQFPAGWVTMDMDLSLFQKVGVATMVTLLRKFIGDPGEKAVEKIRQQVVPQINALEPAMQALSDGELARQTAKFRERLAAGETLDDLLPEAFATVRETARRPEILGQRHYDVQLIGGVALHRGQIAEMKTGEGKTLVATLPVYLNALTGKGVHVVTVNDYLARRDPVWMGPIYHHLGLAVGCLQHDAAFQYDPTVTDAPNGMEKLKPVSREDAYKCDVLYGTNSEFGFDYLRDHLVFMQKQVVQRSRNYAIVDEVDNILIDEARTPLLISGMAEVNTEGHRKFAALARRLKEGDYTIDDQTQAVSLTQTGIDKMELWIGLGDLYEKEGDDPESEVLVHSEILWHIGNALTAGIQKQKDKDYVVQDGEVVIIDEFTGRLQSGRRWSDGLHQAVEAKEGVRIQRESVTNAVVSLQNYYRMYDKLAGMTGTAATEADEFYKIYGLDVIPIPTNLPMIREDKPDLVFLTDEAKKRAVIEEIVAVHQTGRPILVGTASVEVSMDLSERLNERDVPVPHEVLNATNHAREADIIAEAGRLGAVTVSTNMAGRGTDIVLGGSHYGPSTDEWQAKHYKGIDLGVNPKRRTPEDWQAEHKEVVDRGGLYVLGTEHHEARRIDNQLRGRSGRQGDSGSSQFYVSLEDELMYRFGGDRIKSVMNWSGMDEDTPIENKLISKSISGAQEKVEGYHFDARKHLLKFDDVLDGQRKTIYEDREGILDPSRKEIIKVLRQEFSDLLRDYLPGRQGDNWDIPRFVSELSKICPPPPELDDAEKVEQLQREEISQIFWEYAETVYDRELLRDRGRILSGVRRAKIIELLRQEFSDLLSQHLPVRNGDDWEIPRFVSELSKIYQPPPELDDAEKVEQLQREEISQILWEHAETVYNARESEVGPDDMRRLEPLLLLKSIDDHWVPHLTKMENLRTGVGLRAYGQRDPLVEYIREGRRNFQELQLRRRKSVVENLFDDKVAAELLDQLRHQEFIYALEHGLPLDPKQVEQRDRLLRLRAQATAPAIPTQIMVGDSRQPQPGRTKIGRNAPCPCGSGRKYKRCCGANA